MARTDLPELPDFADVVKDLKHVRERGIMKLGFLDLPALEAAVRASGRVECDRNVGPPEIESLIRDALVQFESGHFNDAPLVMFGLLDGTRGYPPPELRTQAADLAGVSRNRFRNSHELVIIDEVAKTILRHCHEHQLRMSALDMERRLPTSSRLAVSWIERFEAYYAMWTPIFATAAAISAYRSTMVEEDRPWDREPTVEEPDGYTQELQAEGYGSQALFFLAEYLAELQRFKTRFGGHWILSSKHADSDLADAAYLVHYRAPFSDRENSFLRKKYYEVAGILDDFREFEDTDPTFTDLHETWQRFLLTCRCSWSDQQPVKRGHFHTSRTESGIDEDCQPHQIIKAANDYCTIVDYEWDQIADWYHIGEARRTGVDGAVLYEDLKRRTKQRGINVWPPWGSVQPPAEVS